MIFFGATFYMEENRSLMFCLVSWVFFKRIVVRRVSSPKSQIIDNDKFDIKTPANIQFNLKNFGGCCLDNREESRWLQSIFVRESNAALYLKILWSSSSFVRRVVINKSSVRILMSNMNLFVFLKRVYCRLVPGW